MTDPNFVQKRMQEIQRDESFAGALGKILSGKSNYKPVIEKKAIIIKCKGCGRQLDEGIKFCSECGTKVFIKPTKCPKCLKNVFVDDKFCQECGTNLDEPVNG